MPGVFWEVVVFTGGAEVARHILGAGAYAFGRASSCEVVLEGDRVSRRHARLTVGEDGSLVLEDLGSSHGTFLDGQLITAPTPVAPNQSIAIGAATLLIQQRAPESSVLDDGIPPELHHPDRYEPGAELARGGMGAVYAAREFATRRTVAMKVMLDGARPRARMRFIEEAQVTAQLEHPNIVPIHELAIDGRRQPYYTMKLVRGITLQKILDLQAGGVAATEEKYPLPALLTIFQKVCDALAFAHSKRVIHRDLKPANIMVGQIRRSARDGLGPREGPRAR